MAMSPLLKRLAGDLPLWSEKEAIFDTYIIIDHTLVWTVTISRQKEEESEVAFLVRDNCVFNEPLGRSLVPLLVPLNRS